VLKGKSGNGNSNQFGDPNHGYNATVGSNDALLTQQSDYGDGDEKLAALWQRWSAASGDHTLAWKHVIQELHVRYVCCVCKKRSNVF
jgi:hypothetical protein